MLWYKGWLETRIKLLATIAFVCAVLILLHAHSGVADGGRLAAIRGIVSLSNLMVVALACVWLAGAGIMTQPAFQNVKGIHGSTLFTLSLPVTRCRLLMARASLGWLMMAGSIGALCCGMWAVSPALRVMASGTEMFEYAGTLLGCGSAFYFLCVLLATFLEDQWRIVSGMVGFSAACWASAHKELPAFADIVWAMGKGSPLLAHSMPWSTIGFSLGLSVVLFFAALKIVRVREY
jgi:hypothetical protein